MALTRACETGRGLDALCRGKAPRPCGTIIPAGTVVIDILPITAAFSDTETVPGALDVVPGAWLATRIGAGTAFAALGSTGANTVSVSVSVSGAHSDDESTPTHNVSIDKDMSIDKGMDVSIEMDVRRHGCRFHFE